MLNIQTQEQKKATLVGVVYEAVAENTREFKQLSEQQIQEKKAEEARKLRETRENASSPDVILDVKNANVPANDTPAQSSNAPQQASRGNSVDLRA